MANIMSFYGLNGNVILGPVECCEKNRDLLRCSKVLVFDVLHSLGIVEMQRMFRVMVTDVFSKQDMLRKRVK